MSDKDTSSDTQRYGRTVAESRQTNKGEAEALGADEDLNHLLGLKCTLEAGGRSVGDSQTLCDSDPPSDGGNDRKRAAASSQQSPAQRTGNDL